MRLTDEQIGAELHALRETPSERFAAELDRRVGDAFPSTEGGPARRRLPDFLTARPLRVALAGGAAIVLAATVAVGVYQRDEQGGRTDLSVEQPQPATPESGGAAGQQAPKATVEQAPGDVIAPEPAPVPPGGERPRTGQPRVQEHSASLTLSTEPDRVQEVADGVVGVTDRYHGLVESSSVQAGGDRGRASFALKIPTANLQAALADLSDLAHVASRNEGTLDITDPFVGAGERFNDARAEVDSLVQQLAQADSPDEAARIRQELALARSELAAARSELRSIKQRADFTSVSVAITAQGDGGSWSIGDAADDAVDVLEALGGAALVTLAVLVPLGGLAALVWLAATRLRKRRRESALDES